MEDAVIVRELSRPEEFQEAVEVQRSAWRMPDYREAAPAHLLRALAANGGLVLGAFHRGRLVGVSYGWPAGYYFYSHATGVLEEAKSLGVGFLLKKAQREKVLERYGLSLAKWTFDPLQSLNSHFNLAKLGAIVAEYHVNYYGEIRDGVNAGLGSDRARAEWWLTTPRVQHRLDHGGRPPLCLERLEALSPRPAFRVEHAGGAPRPGVTLDYEGATIVLVPTPRDPGRLRSVDPRLPRAWREATRSVYQSLIPKGYVLVDNIPGGEGYTFNVLWKASLGDILAGPEPWRDC